MFHWIEARTFCHATEVEERVATALRTIVSEVVPSREELAGHFGNPLIVLTGRAEAPRDLKAIWGRVVGALGKDAMLRELDARLDEDAVYHLRLDKQRAYAGVVEVAQSSDVIDLRAKVAAFPKKREVALRVLSRSVEEI